jgi:hypothetical protein
MRRRGCRGSAGRSGGWGRLGARRLTLDETDDIIAYLLAQKGE